MIQGENVCIPLTKTEKQLLVAAGSRHGRKRHGVSLCEGRRSVQELLDRRPDWVRLLVFSQSFAAQAGPRGLPPLNDVPVKQLPDSEFQAFAKTATPQGVLALFSPQADTSPPPPLPPFALVLDRIADPGNLGTILRTAWAVGLQHVWLTSGTADPLAPKTIRAGMGAQFALTLHTGKPLSALKGTLAEQGFLHMWISTPGGGVSCCSDQFSPLGSALVIGNEANGATTVSGADFVTIPMPGQAESLNVSQAATILLYETVRRGLFA